MAVVRNMRSPQTIGDEWARPGIGVFHAMPDVGVQATGSALSSETPLESAPRQPGQLGPAHSAPTLAIVAMATHTDRRVIWDMGHRIAPLSRPCRAA